MADEVKIEKGIPVPAKREGRKSYYPFARLEVGDSFFVQIDGTDPRIIQQKMSGRASGYRPKKFTCRMVDGGVRVWRIA